MLLWIYKMPVCQALGIQWQKYPCLCPQCPVWEKQAEGTTTTHSAGSSVCLECHLIPCLEMGNHTYTLCVFSRIKKILLSKYLAWCKAHGRCSVRGNPNQLLSHKWSCLWERQWGVPGKTHGITMAVSQPTGLFSHRIHCCWFWSST